MTGGYRKPIPGDTVILRELPRGFVGDLPMEDQKAISEIVGKPVQLNEYDDDGRAELEFTDTNGIIHLIYVSSDLISVAN
jgi:hypothetical protein